MQTETLVHKRVIRSSTGNRFRRKVYRGLSVRKADILFNAYRFIDFNWRKSKLIVEASIQNVKQTMSEELEIAN